MNADGELGDTWLQPPSAKVLLTFLFFIRVHLRFHPLSRAKQLSPVRKSYQTSRLFDIAKSETFGLTGSPEAWVVQESRKTGEGWAIPCRTNCVGESTTA